MGQPKLLRVERESWGQRDRLPRMEISLGLGQMGSHPLGMGQAQTGPQGRAVTSRPLEGFNPLG